MRSVFWPTAVLLGTLASPLVACLWDSDTLEMERRRFPTALNLITGKFLRHSPEFYRWRIKNRLERLQTRADDPKLLDDLAVAYDKTGQHQRAIETMLDNDDRVPGRYETYANLGTFYIHAADLEEGLNWIGKAIAINPDAHFGREVYQELLVRYVISRRTKGSQSLNLPMGAQDDPSSRAVSFAGFVRDQRSGTEKPNPDRFHAATQGILGMMRFGHFDSPVLLEALGDLLLADLNQDAKRLAARAYLKASYAVETPQARAAYRQRAKDALAMQTRNANTTQPLDLAALERRFQTELKDAAAWYAAVQSDETKWIAAGEDADLKFSQKYYRAPSVTSAQANSVHSLPRTIQQWPTSMIAIVCGVLAVSLGVIGLRWRKKQH
ncbi:MAG: hypothetical protein ABGZ17_24635 [Planctomycetaceae bacterium]